MFGRYQVSESTRASGRRICDVARVRQAGVSEVANAGDGHELARSWHMCMGERSKAKAPDTLTRSTPSARIH